MTTYADEVAYYESKVDELRRGQLKAVQAAATKWSALMVALLGVFGTVSFAGGLTTIDKLPTPLDVAVKATTTLAALAAVLAVWFLSRAAGGLRLTDLPYLNGKVLMDREITLITEARRNVGIGKVCAVVTAALILVGSAMVLWAPAAKSPPNLLVRFGDGAYCGKLKRTRDRLTINGRDLRNAVEIVAVTACPAKTR